VSRAAALEKTMSAPAVARNDAFGSRATAAPSFTSRISAGTSAA
jgi:hypothetical protein